MNIKKSDPPKWLNYAPAILIAVVVLFLYAIISSVFGGGGQKPGEKMSINQLVDKAREKAEEVGKLIDKEISSKQDQKQAKEKAKRKALERARQKREAQSQPAQKPASRLGGGQQSQPQPETSMEWQTPPRQASEPLVLATAGNVKNLARMETRRSKGVDVNFFVFQAPGEGDQPFVMGLMGSKFKAKNSFASGVIAFNKPVSVDGRRALSIKLKSKGIKYAGVAALSKSGRFYTRWDFPNLSVGEKWSTMEADFKFFDRWKFDSKDGRYTRLEKGAYPEKIDQIRFFIKPGHLKKGEKAGQLWVESVVLK